MPFKILGLQHVALHVADVAASVNFYQNKLGLQPLPRPAFDFNGAWFALGPGRELHLLEGRQEKVFSSSRGNHFAVQVADIQTVVQYLEQQGVVHRPVKQRPDGAWQIFLEDPDGHVLEFCELIPSAIQEK